MRVWFLSTVGRDVLEETVRGETEPGDEGSIEDEGSRKTGLGSSRAVTPSKSSTTEDVGTSRDGSSVGEEETRNQEESKGRSASLDVVVVSTLVVVELGPVLEGELLSKAAVAHVRVTTLELLGIELGEVGLEELCSKERPTKLANAKALFSHPTINTQKKKKRRRRRRDDRPGG